MQSKDENLIYSYRLSCMSFLYEVFCISTVNRNRMVWKAGELQRAAANMLRHKGSESHVSNSVHALERST